MINAIYNHSSTSFISHFSPAAKKSAAFLAGYACVDLTRALHSYLCYKSASAEFEKRDRLLSNFNQDAIDQDDALKLSQIERNKQRNLRALYKDEMIGFLGLGFAKCSMLFWAWAASSNDDPVMHAAALTFGIVASLFSLCVDASSPFTERTWRAELIHAGGFATGFTALVTDCVLFFPACMSYLDNSWHAHAGSTPSSSVPTSSVPTSSAPKSAWGKTTVTITFPNIDKTWQMPVVFKNGGKASA